MSSLTHGSETRQVLEADSCSLGSAERVLSELQATSALARRTVGHTAKAGMC